MLVRYVACSARVGTAKQQKATGHNVCLCNIQHYGSCLPVPTQQSHRLPVLIPTFSALQSLCVTRLRLVPWPPATRLLPAGLQHRTGCLLPLVYVWSCLVAGLVEKLRILGMSPGLLKLQMLNEYIHKTGGCRVFWGEGSVGRCTIPAGL